MSKRNEEESAQWPDLPLVYFVNEKFGEGGGLITDDEIDLGQVYSVAGVSKLFLVIARSK